MKNKINTKITSQKDIATNLAVAKLARVKMQKLIMAHRQMELKQDSILILMIKAIKISKIPINKSKLINKIKVFLK